MRINTARMESAIEFDFLTLFAGMKAVEGGLVPATKFLGSLELPAFEYHWEKHRDWFYNSFDLQLLRLRCEMLQHLKQAIANEQKTEDDAMGELKAVITEVMGMQKPLTWKRRVIFKFVR